MLGNGPAERRPDGRWRIVPPEPLSTYFVTLVAGPYASVLTEHDGIRLGLHVRESLRAELEAQAPAMLEVTAASFDFYHRVFGIRYPFGEYHQAFVPDFDAGAMENPGSVTFRDSFVVRGRVTRDDRAGRAGVIAHEMAHQWFGDLVTMQWWDDLWLNESFAEWASTLCQAEATHWTGAWTTFQSHEKTWAYQQDQLPSTHPVYADIRDLDDVLGVANVHELGDDRQARLLARFGEEPEPLGAETLERVRGGTRLVGAAAEHGCPAIGDGPRHLERLSAAERSRTFTGASPHGPEPCASTSSATAAGAGNLPVRGRPPHDQPHSLESPLLAAIV